MKYSHSTTVKPSGAGRGEAIELRYSHYLQDDGSEREERETATYPLWGERQGVLVRRQYERSLFSPIRWYALDGGFSSRSFGIGEAACSDLISLLTDAISITELA